MKILIAIFAALCITGCAPTLSPLEQKTMQTMRDDFATQMQTLKNKETLDLQAIKSANDKTAENGKNAPIFHPMDAANQTVVELHPWLKYATIILAAGAIGVWVASFFFTTLTFLPKLALALTKGAILSLTAMIAIPFGVKAMFVLIIGFVVIWVFESIRNHFDERQATVDTLAAIGIKMGSTAPAAVAEAKVMAANPPRVPPVEKPPLSAAA